MITIDGLVSGIDTQKILDGLLQIQQGRIDRLKVQKQEVLTKQAAFQGIEASIISFRSAVARLSRTQDNVFSKQQITTSDDTLLTATAKGAAASGVFRVSIESVASAHQVASQSFTSADAAITHGTIEFRSGDGPVTSIVIDSSNDTLQGLADEIANSSSGIAASVIQDGSGYRLLLSAEQTGTAFALQINNGLAASSGGATAVAFDLGAPVQAATDSTVKLGSGPGAITATVSGTTVESLIPGLSLNLLRAAPGESVTVQVRPDTEGAVTAVDDFVTAYNELTKTIAAQTQFVAATNTAGVLLGENSVIDMQNAVQSALQEAVGGVNGKMNRLRAIGISFNDNGTLTLDNARLQNVLNGTVADVDAADARRLFALSGESNLSGVTFLLGSSRTQGSASPYQVDISRAAEQAQLTSSAPLPGSTLIDDTNDTLSLALDGQSIDVVLEHGTYTRTELATKLAKTINAQPSLLGRRATALINADDTLTLHSDSYGRTSQLTLSSGTALAALGFTAGATDTGVDVAGQFIVNGVPEPAAGNGRVLSGNSTNANTADLQVRVTLNPAEITTGTEAEILVTQGIASRVDKLLGGFLDVDSGRLGIVNRSFTARADTLQTAIDRQNATFDSQRDRLLKQLVSLESAISQIQGTSSLLGAQLASLNKLSNN